MTCVGTYSLAPAAGTANSNTELDLIDLSRAKAIRLELFLTGKGSATGADTLNIYFQEASDDVTPTWDDRAAFPQLTGALTVSAAAPEKYVIQWQCLGTWLQATDSSYEPSGSAGASHIAAGAYYPGPLKGKRYGSGTVGQVARHRLRMEQVDADSSASYVGEVRVFIEGGG